MTNRLTEDDLSLFEEEEENNEEDPPPPPPATVPALPEVPINQLRSDHNHVRIPERVLKKDIEGEANISVFEKELEAFDMYLENIHTCFRYATSIHAVSRLVKDALSVHKQRRATLEHAMKIKPSAAIMKRYDLMGNEID